MLMYVMVSISFQFPTFSSCPEDSISRQFRQVKSLGKKIFEIVEIKAEQGFSDFEGYG